MMGLASLALAFGLFWLVWIIATLLWEGASALRPSLFLQPTPPPGGDGGLANAILGSVMMAGVGAILALPIAQYPDVAPPQVSIRATYPGANAETIQNSVTQVIEQQLTGIDGLLYFSSSSTSRRPASTVVSDSRSMNSAMALPDPIILTSASYAAQSGYPRSVAISWRRSRISCSTGSLSGQPRLRKAVWSSRRAAPSCANVVKGMRSG